MSIKILNMLFDFLCRGRNKSSQARLTYNKHIAKKVEHLKRFESRDWVYIDEPPRKERSKREKISTGDPSAKLKPKKMGPYKVIRSTKHPMTVNIDGLHDVLLINRIFLAQKVA